jgi:hypothetical protein
VVPPAERAATEADRMVSAAVAGEDEAETEAATVSESPENNELQQVTKTICDLSSCIRAWRYWVTGCVMTRRRMDFEPCVKPENHELWMGWRYCCDLQLADMGRSCN